MGNLTDTQLYISLAIAAVLGGALAYLLWKERQRVKNEVKGKKKPEESINTLQLQLQAYERLILLADRIALPNIVSRTNQSGLSVQDMQFLLTHAIKQEFEHNITQQIYVTAEAWEAVRNLKDQNIHIINQVASFLPTEATGTDLNKHILDMIVQNPKVSLHNIVSEALSFEAKKLMKQSS